MKKYIVISALCCLFLGSRAQLKCNSSGKLVMGSTSVAPNTSYDWNINSYQGLNWVKRFGNTTRKLTIDLTGSDACISSSFGEIKFYSLNPSTLAKTGYASAYCRYLYEFPLEDPGPVMMPTGQEGSSGNRLLGTMATLARSVQTMQNRLLETGLPSSMASRQTTGDSYLLITTLDGQTVSRQTGNSLSAVDKSGLAAGTYRCTLFVDGQPAETTNIAVMDF